jgi:type IV secretion system protein VirB5
MGQIDATTDQKAIDEIQARVVAENALLHHEQTQIEMARGLAEAEYRIAEARAKEAQLQQASRTGRLAHFVR